MMLNFQQIYFNANKRILDDSLTIVLKKHFDTQNERYNYCSTESEKAQAEQDYICFYKFFYELYISSAHSNREIQPFDSNKFAGYAYKAMVLFGGQQMQKAINTIQQLVNDIPVDTTKKSCEIIESIFAKLQLPSKSQDLNLPFWRGLLNGPQLKRAFELFPKSSALAEHQGKLPPFYTLALTNTFPKFKNTKEGIVYLFKPREPQLVLGYAFKNPAGEFVSGEIESSKLSFYDKLVGLLIQPGWKLNEYRCNLLDRAEQDSIFFQINQVNDTPIARLPTLSDVEEQIGKMVYKRFSEAPDLGLFCLESDLSELVFNRCLKLYKQPKKSDIMPDIYLDGAECGHPGYHLLKLPNNDYRALVLGYIVKCCQSIGRKTEQLVIDGWKMKNRGFYVLLKQHRPGKLSVEALLNPKNASIIGECYAWRSALNNVVIDSWESLLKEHDEVTTDMVREYAQRMVNDPKHHVFRVTIGGKGPKTPPMLKAKITKEKEVMSKGYQYRDTLFTQAEITSRDVVVWERELIQFLEQYPNMPQKKKYELVAGKQKSIFYIDMLKILLDDPLLTSLVLSHHLPKNSLMVLYVIFQNEPAKFAKIIKNLLEHIPVQHLNTDLLRIYLVFIKELVLGSGLETKPTLYEDINVLIQLLKPLDIKELEPLFALLIEHRQITLLMALSIKPYLLKEILPVFSENTRCALIRVKKLGRSVLHHTADNYELFSYFLNQLPKDDWIVAVWGRGIADKPMLHCAVSNPKTLGLILNIYPKAKRLEEIQKPFGDEEHTVLHLAVSYPQSLKTILDSLPKNVLGSKHFSITNKQGMTVLDCAEKVPESLEIIRNYLSDKALPPIKPNGNNNTPQIDSRLNFWLAENKKDNEASNSLISLLP